MSKFKVGDIIKSHMTVDPICLSKDQIFKVIVIPAEKYLTGCVGIINHAWNSKNHRADNAIEYYDHHNFILVTRLPINYKETS